MAQPGNFTPILLYGSSTPGNVPVAANLTNSATGSEIAINVADKNLFFKDSGGTVNTVPIRQSSTSSNGWLSSTDWNTFNNKAPATSGTSILYGNGTGGFSNVTIGSGISFAGGTLSATGTGGTVTSVAALTLGTTGTDLNSTVANGTTTPVITLNVPTASAANRGALSAADWSTFNSKAPGVTFTTGYVPFGQGSTTLNQSANLTFATSTLTVSTTSTSVGAKTSYTNTASTHEFGILPTGYGGYGVLTAGAAYIYGGNNQPIQLAVDNSYIAFGTGTGATERGRFNSSGQFLVGTTAGVVFSQAGIQNTVWNGTSYDGLALHNTNTSTNLQYSIVFGRNGTLVGSVQTSNTATVYVTTSDYRLKENVLPMVGALDKVKQLKPVTYTWKLDGSNAEGFIAHELAQVCPQAVTGIKDETKIVETKDETGKVIETKEVPVYQGIDTSFLVATLTAAIQELNDKFDAYVASHP